MNDTGQNIVSGFRELRTFCHQVSLLLRTTRDMMMDEQWKRAGPTPVFEGSRSIAWPG